MFHKNSGSAVTNELGCLLFPYAGGYHQDLAAKSLLLGQVDEFSAVALTEVEVKKHNVDLFFAQHGEGFLDGLAMRANLETGLIGQEPSHALPKQGVVIHQQNADSGSNWVSHSACPRSWPVTAPLRR